MIPALVLKFHEKQSSRNGDEDQVKSNAKTLCNDLVEYLSIVRPSLASH